METKQYNMRNPGVKRIMQEIKEMQKDCSKEYISYPLEEDIFEWQFAIHGPPDTEFEGGIYHGRIILPGEYPFKPPAFMLLTPSGRFETQKKICLSISQYHPEEWQPSWSVRTALVALIAFMPTKGDGAIGSLDFTKEERKALARKSRIAPPVFGSPPRQSLIAKIHEEMLQSARSLPSPMKSEEPQPPSPIPADSESSNEVTAVETEAVEKVSVNPSAIGAVQPKSSSGDLMFTLLVAAIVIAIIAIIVNKFRSSAEGSSGDVNT